MHILKFYKVLVPIFKLQLFDERIIVNYYVATAALL